MELSLIQKFPLQPQAPTVKKAEGVYLYLEDGKKILDATSGWCAQHTLGYSHPEVLQAMKEQMETFCHVDYNRWHNPKLEELAELLLSQAPKGLDKVYFCGTSGSEAVESAMKLSYQWHYNQGKPTKTHFISRDQSYHGATLQSVAASGLDLFEFYAPLLPKNHAKIPLHYPLREMKAGESLDDYARRGAKDLEDKILEIGPEKVCAFVAETMLGSLLGDVPPAPGYWKYIREVCDRYDVHLILDEVYCGLGRSGRIYCCSWDDVTPDFISLSKALGGGYAPLSAVVLKHAVEDSIKNGQGRIHSGHTYQGYSLGCAAALAIQKVTHRPETLSHVMALSEYLQKGFHERLKDHPYYVEVHGRGSMFSIEYNTPNNHPFGLALHDYLVKEYGVLVSAKWHRISFSLPFILSFQEADVILDAVTKGFKDLAARFDF
jgi:adenosylmethionine-8-amino-7-oxononanoate aminotransferase